MDNRIKAYMRPQATNEEIVKGLLARYDATDAQDLKALVRLVARLIEAVDGLERRENERMFP